MSKQRRSEQTNTVSAAEAAVAQLEQKLEQHRARSLELGDARKRLSFAAHAQHDAEAGRELADVVDATVRHETEARALADAVAEAQRRVERARQDEAKAADRKAASELRATLAQFVAQGEQLDAALATIAETGVEMRETLSRMHGLGSGGFPSHQQLDVLGSLCLRTALQRTPWDRHFERLAPNQRRSFGDLVHQWSATVEQQIRARLGEQPKEKADAA